MKRSKWPLLSALTIAVFLLTGYALVRSADPVIPESEADIRKLGLGSASTAVIAVTGDCSACVESVDFYKRLMALPAVDGQSRRVVVVAMDGAMPARRLFEPHGFKPHSLTSGPYKFKEIAGVSQPGTILVLDAAGNQRGKWVGPLTASQEQEVIRAMNAE